MLHINDTMFNAKATFQKCDDMHAYKSVTHTLTFTKMPRKKENYSYSLMMLSSAYKDIIIKI